MLHITRVWRDDAAEPTSPHERGSGRTPARLPGAELPTVSVVLVARAGQVELTRALEALATQTYPARLLEVIVVCASGEERTSRMVAALARRRPGLRLRFVTCGREHGMGAARNCGWRCATGSIVAFTTDEVVPGPTWLESAVAAFDPVVDVVGGQIVVPLAARPSVPARRAAERLQVPWTAHNVFYRRSLLRELGGLDEGFSRQGHDDTDLILTALAAGARFCAAEGAVVVHERPSATWRDELGRQVLHADEARLFRKHPHLYAQYVRPAPPAADYLALAALGALLASAATGRRTPARVAAALWAGITLVRVRRAARDTSPGVRDLAALACATAALPPLTVGLRLYGALRQRVWFL